ncbi:MAG: CocE/NonD family hydrolase [Deltaproteobacteria bacterium]|nr:CocE/NonD family hydrolase [Deltaproteobacteria bacterium]
MRDGVALSATVYRDPKETKRVPAIVTMTPYIAAHAARQGVYFAQNGYVFVAVDSRGRGNSDGRFVPGQVEAHDGYDLVEWAAKQPWCDGQVAMWGGSWLGFTQWTTAKEMPPHLKAIAPTAAVYPGVDYPQAHGMFFNYALQWLQFVNGRALNQGMFDSEALWRNAAMQLFAQKGSFQDLEGIAGATGTVFRTWIQHPREDAFWQAMTPTAADYAKLRIPVLTITGAYDADQLGALTYYARHMASGAAEVIARHWLLIGPWSHSGTRRPTPDLGGVTFGPGAVLDMEALHKAWYDHVLKGGPRPEQLPDRVNVFVMGTNTWIHAPDLAHVENTPLRFELDVAGAVAGDIGRTGRLGAKVKNAGAVVLTSDPLAVPSSEELEAEFPEFLRDQRDSYKVRASRVVLQTAPFDAATVISGRPRVHVQVSSDQPDADLWAELDEVLPDGSAIQLADTGLRLRYRGGGVAGVPLVKNKLERIELPPMTFFARSIAKGSRLRLVLDAGPFWGVQANNHTGGDAASEPLTAARVGKLTIYTGPGRDSALELTRPDDALLPPAPAPR